MYTNGATATKVNAGTICVNVRAACDANVASSAASCGGADCGGCISAIVRRSTTTAEIAVQAQNPMRIQRQETCILGHTTNGSDNHCKTCVYTDNHHSTPEHDRPAAFGTLAKLGSLHTGLLPGHTSDSVLGKALSFSFRSQGDDGHQYRDVGDFKRGQRPGISQGLA